MVLPVSDLQNKKNDAKLDKTNGIMCGRYCQTCKRKYWINNKEGFRIKNCVKCRLSRESEN